MKVNFACVFFAIASFAFCIFCVLKSKKKRIMDVEVSGATEIVPTTSNGANAVSSKDAGYQVIPYGGELVDPHRVGASSGQRIKLQAEVNSDYKFLTICDPASLISFFCALIHLLFISIINKEVLFTFCFNHIHIKFYLMDFI